MVFHGGASMAHCISLWIFLAAMIGFLALHADNCLLDLPAARLSGYCPKMDNARGAAEREFLSLSSHDTGVTRSQRWDDVP